MILSACPTRLAIFPKRPWRNVKGKNGKHLHGSARDVAEQKSIPSELYSVKLRDGRSNRMIKPKPRHTQLVLQSIVEQAFRNRRKAIHAYLANNREKYIAFADMLRPNLSNEHDIFARIAFAILSANAPFEDSVKALGYCVERYRNNQDISRRQLVTFNMIPVKADWLNLLAQDNLKGFRRTSGETWNSYRLRLRKEIKGLGLTQASFSPFPFFSF